MPATTTADRLTFRSWKPFSAADGFAAYVAVTERKSAKRSITTTYAVRILSDLPHCKVFHVFKEGETEPRELRVYPAGHVCNCESGKYRPGVSCRHLSSVQHLTEEGVI